MRTFIAGLCHESSTFSSIPTSRRSFEEFDFFRPGSDSDREKAFALNGYGRFASLAADDGDDVVLSTYTFAQPSAPATKVAYESLRDEILDDLRNAGPVDMVLLFLHGAQMADGYNDCEGDFLACVRDIVGETAFVGALLDLHANVSQAMLDHADALVACRHYPHIDFNERAEHLYHFARRYALEGRKPVMHYRRVPMLGMFYTTAPLMMQVNDRALAVQERAGIASVSLIHGFAWADVPFVGAGVLIVADADTDDQQVKDMAEDLSQAFFDVREETRSMRIPIDEALQIAEEQTRGTGPVVIADPCDNAGGGAASDATFIPAQVFARGLTGYAFGLIWDQVAVAMAFDLELGARFNFRIGGKCGPGSGDPLDVSARVVALRRNMTQIGIGYTHPIGDAALLESNGNYIVICTTRGQVFSPTCFTDLGVDLSQLKAVVVKSSQHFYDQFAPVAARIIYCETPAAMPLHFSGDQFEMIQRPIWPIDALEEA